MLRYGHLRSAPVVVGAGYARSGNRPHSLHPSVNSTRFGASSVACCLSYDAQTRLLVAAILDIATRSLFGLRTSRLLQFEVHVAKCQVKKVHCAQSDFRRVV